MYGAEEKENVIQLAEKNKRMCLDSEIILREMNFSDLTLAKRNNNLF